MSKCSHRWYSRSFLGPIPEKVLDSMQENYQRAGNLDIERDGDEEHTTPALRLVKKHAFSFFIREGGKPEDWDEQVQMRTRKKMICHWHESDWGKALHDRTNERESADRWIGNSFDIGKFLGLDVMNSPGLVASETTQPQATTSQIKDPSRSMPANIPGELASDTLGSIPPSDIPPPIPGPSSGSNLDEIGADGVRKSVSPSKAAKMSASTSVRVTHHALDDEYASAATISDVARGYQGSGSNLSAPLLPEATPGDDILKDRMLVRAYYSEVSLLHQQFNAEYHRTARDLEYKAFGEFLVVLRRSRVELYEDYGLPLREWLSGHKRLAFVIPLSIAHTQLSLYSFVDLTFCLTYSPKSAGGDAVRSRWTSFLFGGGSKIFIFKLKSRSRAYDWLWKLWLQLGGRPPTSLEVKNPTLNATVTIDAIDGNEIEKVYDTFSYENVVRSCVKAFSSVPDWSSLIQREISNGKKLALAWRVDANLDWVWLETDVNEKPRKWAVLCGFITRKLLKGAALELRLAEHYPIHIHLRGGNKFNEPPGVEGYLQQIRPNSLTKHRVYLSSYDGNLFVLPIQRAYPPPPPGFLPHDPYSGIPDKPAWQVEVWRGALQVMHASGVCDVRNIIAVRRATQLVPVHTHNEHQESNDGDNLPIAWTNEEPSLEDDQDEGGDERSGNSGPLLRTRRSFELLLKNGHVIRFEAYSARLALEWVNRLRALVSYWAGRHRYDAQHEMDLAQASRPRLTPQIRHCHEEGNHAPLKLPSPLSELVTLCTASNWCTLEGCRPIVRGGKLFVRKGLRGQYRLVQMFLVANHLVQYSIGPNSLLHPTFKKICLSDVYVCSGYLAALTLPEGEFDPSKTPSGRRYLDGLETDDSDEDTIFVVHHRSRSRHAQGALYHSDMTGGVPPLSSRQKKLVFRTRSKLERDSWCWAINCEIERTVRIQRDGEDALRNNGNVIPSRHS